MQCHNWASRTRSRSRNEVIGNKFRHLVVNTSQTPYKRSITNNCTPISLVKSKGQLSGHHIIFKHKNFRAPKILIRQSSHAYANVTIMPMPGLYSCMSKYILQTCHVYIHAWQII
ncbi:hypothetical protein M9H77_06621 [Catharanthus roseus]|uniref:Uncharacterized protein n=1 Tax=Catharanthus roseus TaxID=4058 RepID=A0ACC0BSU8_CATRO|nr:hypothetical protein M9H77_06621 [Catharanthus roseus]